MKTKQFNDLVKMIQADQKLVLCSKAEDYASDEERFINFHNAANLQARGNTPEAALWNMAAKHLEATQRAIGKIELGVVMPLEFWKEKLGDIRNYMILLEGLVRDRLEEEGK